MEIKKAAIINAAGKYTRIILSMLVSAILARLVSPGDHGIIAVITVFTTLFATLSDMGFGPAIIQNKELTEEDVGHIFSFTVYVSFALMGAFCLCVFPIASFYGDKTYIPLGRLLSISLLFNAMNMVPNGIMNRNKEFKKLAFRAVLVYTGSAVVTIILAFYGFRYYALAFQSILTAVLTFVWNYKTTKPKFYLRIQFASIKKVLNYSGYQFAFNMVNYFSRNLDNLLTAKYLGSAELAYYHKSYSLMLYPVNNLTGVVSPVLHPLLSDYQNQLDVIYQKYMKVVRILACIAVFVAPVCYLAADEMIAIMYGPSWEQSVFCFQVLSVAIIPQMMNSSAGSIFQAIGNTRLLFINSCINTTITITAILIGVFGGGNIEALSICVSAAYICHFLTAFTMLIKMGFGKRMCSFIKELLPEVLILIVMIAAVILYPLSISNVFISAMAKGMYLGLIYIAALIVSKEHKLLLSLVKK